MSSPPAASTRSFDKSRSSTRCRTGAALADNYLENNVITQDQDAFDIRSDLVLGKWGSLFARYSRADRDFVEPPTANIFMSGGNRSESGNYNAVIGHTYTLSSARLNEFRFGINKYDLAPVRFRFRYPEEQRAGDPQWQHRGAPLHIRHRRLQCDRLPAYCLAGIQQFRADRQDSAVLRHLHLARRQALAEIRRRLPEHLVNADQPPDAAPRIVHLRPQLHQQPRRREHRAPVRQFPPRSAESRSARFRRHLSRSQDSLRRLLRAGRLPRHAESHAESWTAMGPADLASGEKQPSDELQPRRRSDSPRVAGRSRPADDQLLRWVGAATGRRVFAG